MKQNEILDQKKLESVNSEIFHSFDPEEASWIIGGGGKFTSKATYTPDGGDGEVDFEYTF